MKHLLKWGRAHDKGIGAFATLAEKVMTRFMREVCEGTPRSVSALFAPNAFVLPTLKSQGFSEADTRAYFEYFLENPGRCGEFDSMNVLVLSPVSALVTGMWTFWTSGMTRPTDPDEEQATARYSAVIVQTPKGPRIAHLHSSVDPEAE